jgi:ribosome-binding protein aMBF1 (putative translation factor)
MTLEISLQPSLAAYVSEQAAAAHTSPARYVQRLIKQQQEREKTLMRALVGNYLELIKKDADKKGWIPASKIKQMK